MSRRPSLAALIRPSATVLTATFVVGCAALPVGRAPDASQAPAQTDVYGSGIAIDAKDNVRVSSRRLAHRFVAGTSSELLSIQVQQRGGDGYSSGNGGRLEVSVRSDDGGPDHLPSDDVLASLVVTPGNPEGDWTTYERWTFPDPPALVAGTVYHIVFENTGDSPDKDYISINEVFTYEPDRPRQPALDDAYAVLIDRGDGWELDPRNTADMDLAYADGSHDGQAYIQNMCDRFGAISGPERMVRQTFRVTGGDRSVAAVSVRLKRTFGDEPITADLVRADGTSLASHEVRAQDVPVAASGCTEGGADWVTFRYPQPILLDDGSLYELRLRTGTRTQYTADPIREGTDQGMVSYRFTDGGAQASVDGGRSWADLYAHSPVDLQFYFELSH